MKKSFIQKTLILVACFVLAALVGNLLLFGILLLDGGSLNNISSVNDFFSNISNPIFAKLGIGINHLVTFIGTAVLYHRFIKEDTFEQYFKLKPDVDHKLIGLFILLLFCSYPIIGASGMIFQYIDLPEWMSSMDEDYTQLMEAMFSQSNVFSILLNVVVVALLPAIGEELIFRGIVQKELHRVIPNPHIAIFVTSVLFSAVHMQAAGFLPKLIISLILCYGYWWTKNLTYPIMIHFVNNAFLTLSVYFSKDKLTEANLENIEQMPIPWSNILLSLVLCVGIVYFIKKQLSTNETL